MLSRIGSFRSSSKATGEGSAIPAMITDGLLAEWRFAEGSGTTVADSFGGTYPINLNLPTTPNYTWSATGIDLAAGLVQTPSLPSVRTVVLAYKMPVGGGGASFLISGGSGSGDGELTTVHTTTRSAWVAYGAGVRPLSYATSGSDVYTMHRGGWVVFFFEYPIAYTTPFGFGGRHSTTTSRMSSVSIGWAASYNKALNSAERTQILNYVAAIMKPRGAYLKTADCPTQADAVLLMGQSNALGSAPLTDLTVPERTYLSTKTKIEPASQSVLAAPPAAFLQMGTNQTAYLPESNFGAEYGIAVARDAAGGRDLYISKTAQGSTYAAPTSVGGSVTATNTWHPGTYGAGNLLLRYALCRDWHFTEQYAAANGIGLNLRAALWMQGEQDATATTYAASSAAYQGYLQNIYNEIVLQTAMPGLPMIVARIRDQDPSMNATAKANVRSGQAAFVTANSGCVLIDTDSFPLQADNVHYTGAGMKSLGTAFYNAVTW